jgi:hypothetical protein
MPATVRLMPDHDNPNLLARPTPDTPRQPLPVEVRLHRAIPRRHSNRAPFVAKPVPVDVRAALIAAARVENVCLDLMLGPSAVGDNRQTGPDRTRGGGACQTLTSRPAQPLGDSAPGNRWQR